MDILILIVSQLLELLFTPPASTRAEAARRRAEKSRKRFNQLANGTGPKPTAKRPAAAPTRPQWRPRPGMVENAHNN